MNKIGALWVRKSKKNEKYMSGTLEWAGEEIPVVCFKNKNKKTDKHPDLVVYEREPYEQPSKPAPPPPPEEDPFEDIPF